MEKRSRAVNNFYICSYEICSLKWDKTKLQSLVKQMQVQDRIQTGKSFAKEAVFNNEDNAEGWKMLN